MRTRPPQPVILLSSAAVILVLLAASRVNAQAFVSGSIFADVKRFSGDGSGTPLDGESIGGSVSAGTAMTDRWDVEIGIDVPRFSEVVEERSLTLRSTRLTLESVTRTRVASVSSLVRFRPGNSALRLGYSAGFVFVRMREELETRAPAEVPSSLIPRPVASIIYAASPMVGVDAQWRLNSRLYVIPAVSAFAIRAPEISGVVVRPRIGVRWAF